MRALAIAAIGPQQSRGESNKAEQEKKKEAEEMNGDDLRRDPLEVRKATLEMILAKAWPGIRFNEHMQRDETVFRHACKLGLEDIVSKRKDSAYRLGRSPKSFLNISSEASKSFLNLHL